MMSIGWIASLVLIASLLYSSVGFGGASSYLAAMSLFAVSPNFSATIALCLNILVAGIAFANYFRHGHLRPHLLWPFLITSIPAAFVGGALKVEQSTYQLLLNVVLLFVAMRLLFYPKAETPAGQKFVRPGWVVALSVGALIGIVSGIVGIGGGIFLSPIIVLSGWGNAKHAAASSAAFIVLNSISGLIGRAWGGTFTFGVLGAILIPIGVIGGLVGSLWGARYLPNRSLQRVLAVVLLIIISRNVLLS